MPNDVKFVASGGEPLIMLVKIDIFYNNEDFEVSFEVHVCKNLT